MLRQRNNRVQQQFEQRSAAKKNIPDRCLDVSHAGEQTPRKTPDRVTIGDDTQPFPAPKSQNDKTLKSKMRNNLEEKYATFPPLWVVHYFISAGQLNGRSRMQRCQVR